MEWNVILALCLAGTLFIGSILLWVFADPFKVAEKLENRTKDKKDL